MPEVQRGCQLPSSGQSDDSYSMSTLRCDVDSFNTSAILGILPDVRVETSASVHAGQSRKALVRVG